MSNDIVLVETQEEPDRDAALGTEEYHSIGGNDTLEVEEVAPAAYEEELPIKEELPIRDERPIKKVVPDTRTPLEIAVATPLPPPAYTAKTVARHEKARKKQEYEDMIRREKRRRDRELLYKRERIMNAYTGQQGMLVHRFKGQMRMLAESTNFA